MKLFGKYLILIVIFGAVIMGVNQIWAVTSGSRTWEFTGSDNYTYDSSKLTVSNNKIGLVSNTTPTWLDNNWSYRKKITIGNSNVGDLTNYQVKVTLSYESEMQNDFDDIRFTDTNGTTLLDYWLESKVNGSSAIYWVKIPTLSSSTNKDLYVYYGNASTTTLSNGTSTFVFFDDFESYSYGTFSANSKWNVYTQDGAKVEIVDDDVAKVGYFNGTGIGTYKIGAFVPNEEGTTAQKHTSLAVLEAGSGFESDGVKDPYTVKINGKYYMWYSGYNGTNWNGIGLAISDDGFNFEKYESNPVLTMSQPYENSGVAFPTVYYDESDIASKRYKMFYSCSVTSNFEYRLCYAYSADGISWTKYANNPVVTVGTNGTWDDYAVGISSDVVKVGSTYYLYYGGRSSATDPWKVGLVTFTDFEGTYTKHASNPLIAGRTASSTTLTSSAGVGTTLLQVADTSNFVVNESVYISNGTNDEMVRISSIQNSTNLLVSTAITRTYNVGSTVVSWAAGSMSPRHVRYNATTGQWLQWITAFQPYGTSGILRESTMLVTSSDLTNWTINYGLSPLVSFGTNWDTNSAENVMMTLGTQTTGVKSAFIISDGDAVTSRIASVGTTYGNYVMEMRMKYPKQTNVWVNFRASQYNQTNPNGYFLVNQLSNHRLAQYNSGWTNEPNSVATLEVDKYYRTKIIANGNNQSYYMLNDDGTSIINGSSAYSAFSSGYVGLSTYSTNSTLDSEAYIDWLFLRSVATTEPSITTGTEQSHYDRGSPAILVTESSGLTLPNNASLTGFSQTATVPAQASIGYQISKDGGSNWYYWNGLTWTTTGDNSNNSNNSSVVNSNISQLAVNVGDNIVFRIYMTSNGLDQIELEKFTLNYQYTEESSGTVTLNSPGGGVQANLPPSCGKQVPGNNPPKITSIISKGTEALEIYFTQGDGPMTKYILMFGEKSGVYTYGSTNIGEKGSWKYTIDHLKPGTKYYLKIAQVNDCATGPWSEEVSMRTDTILDKLIGSDLKIVENSFVPEKTNPDITKSINILKIKIVDEDNKPMAGVEVELHSDVRKATTDNNGEVIFEDVESGEHTIKLNSNELNPTEQKIYVDESKKKIDLTIKTKVQEDKTGNNMLLILAVGTTTIAVLILIIKLLSRKK